METSAPEAPANKPYRDPELNRYYARESYRRHSAEICARKKIERDAKRQADIEAGISRPGRGRPREVFETPAKVGAKPRKGFCTKTPLVISVPV